MPGIRIVTDSASDLPRALAAEQGITIVPLTVRFGDQEVVDGSIPPADFWARSAASPTLPTTAAPSPGSFEEAFRAAAAEGADGVACITISSKLSATGQSAEAAAKTTAGTIPVTLVDSLSATMGEGMIVLEAARAAAAGARLEQVVAAAESARARSRVFGTLDTLENLKKGGRIGGAQALLGSLLSIKPVVEVRDGRVEPGPKPRTRSRALKWLVDQVASESSPIQHLSVMHGAAPDVDEFLDMLGAHFPRDRIIVADLGAVIGAHTGPRTIGAAYLV